MKTAQFILSVPALLTGTLSAPTPNVTPSGISFPITDLLDKNITIDEYFSQLEESAEASKRSLSLTKRQYGSDTYNQLTDGTPCRDITVIWARGTTQDGNVGDPTSEGPALFNALAARVGGTNRLAIQGVNYAANVLGFLLGGDPNGIKNMGTLINTAASQCPSTKIVLSGYSQGAQVVHGAVTKLTASVAARVNAVVTFGDPDVSEGYGLVDSRRAKVWCNAGDNICAGGIIITQEHRDYEKFAPDAATFIYNNL